MFSVIKGYFQRMFRSSLVRLTIILCLIFTLIFVAVSVTTYFLVTKETLRQIDSEIEAGLANLDNKEFSPRPDYYFTRVARFRDLPEAFRAEISPRDGKFIESIDDPFRGDWRIVINRTGEAWSLGAARLNSRDDTLDVLMQVFLLTGGIGLLSFFGLGLSAARFSQRRLDHITQTLNDLSEGKLKSRTQMQGHRDDIDVLGRNVDKTAEQLEILVSQTRNLSANIAHDLRTPLARLRANLEQYIAGDEDAFERAAVEAERMSEIFNAIMRIARIEAATGNEGFEMLELSDIAAEVYDVFEPVVTERGKRLKLETLGSSKSLLDRQLIVQALANLIQNAIVYGGDNITLYTNQNGIGVCDDGDGVDPENFDNIIRPMVRLDDTRQSEGAGLGLAMVRAIADRHKARLQLSTNEPHGLCVSIVFKKI